LSVSNFWICSTLESISERICFLATTQDSNEHIDVRVIDFSCLESPKLQKILIPCADVLERNRRRNRIMPIPVPSQDLSVSGIWICSTLESISERIYFLVTGQHSNEHIDIRVIDSSGLESAKL